MATASTKTMCAACNKTKITYSCEGCSQRFCHRDLDEHKKSLENQLDHIENDHDQLRENLHDQITNPTKQSLIKQLDQWEKDSIHKIKQIADQCREKLINYSNIFLLEKEKKLNDLAQEIKEMRQEKEFNEIDLDHLTEVLYKLQEELVQPPNVFIKQQSRSLINNISVLILLQKDTRWKQFGVTVAGGNGEGNRLDQLSSPWSIYIDDNDQTIYIADWGNHHIMEWKANATNGRIVAGGNGQGNETNQLNQPKDVVIDRENNSLIIADAGNRRVMRWSRQTTAHGEIIISDIDCSRLAMHKDGSLYVSDWKKNEVKRWKKGETKGIIVAGGNGQGNRLNQFHSPTYLFVDDDHILYVSDFNNHRVMKWVKDAKEGIVVAGGNGEGDRPTQLPRPRAVLVDRFGQIYVADAENHRVMRWCEGAKEGTIVVGGNGSGEQANQLNLPTSLSFDGEGNLYVADCGNHRIQKFVID